MGGGHPQLIFQHGRGDGDVAAIDVVDEDGEREQGQHVLLRSWQLLVVYHRVRRQKRAPRTKFICLSLPSVTFPPNIGLWKKHSTDLSG